VKFLVDMALSPALAQWLRSQGHDAVHAGTVGLARAPDVDIIAHAKQDGRIVVTADLDYPRILRRR
jgi:predicted nuclease of predicted toxin-antitoxin system